MNNSDQVRIVIEEHLRFRRWEWWCEFALAFMGALAVVAFVVLVGE